MVVSPLIGFIGLGTMGEPMALNLATAGIPLRVWSRSTTKYPRLVAAGATAMKDIRDLYHQCGTIILMLTDGGAIDAVLARNEPEFPKRVAARTIVNMSTVPPEYSLSLATDIQASGGRYVEAPVSGSRQPAQAGRLVAMLAGREEDVEAVRPLLAAMCHESFDCGPVPGALRMKLAINTFLITLVTGLAEATHFAQRHRLDMACFAAILDAGPMASDVSRSKMTKLLQHNFERQAGITDVLKNNRLVVESARAAGIASPLMDICLALYANTEAMGLGETDMVSVIKAIGIRDTGSGPGGIHR
ncbi:6-phosphogluconate dehydrogenase [Alcanivorax xiamenensis]|uniref:6-phosphogluconate dehydrogenase n=1 Tax=Alcanivorax xiamenensis TaxID=1177156 RepID=A0ABQ6YAG2_9GAMM|nr:NAD(P)-dependent oxidoreductase [Alcanivorax xiamenensis]KAF0806748.1 6-phosphogluconate dehydrogenase [Alcanivorax xiamenensis]